MTNNTNTTCDDATGRHPGGRRRSMGFALAGATLAGAGLLALPAIAGAQDDGSTVTEDAPGGPGVVLDELVAEGVLTQEQADAVEEAFREHRQEIREERGAFDFEVITDLLGLSGEEIREALRSGQTLAEVAADQGVSEEALVDAIVTERQSQIDEKVADGTLTEERAAEISEGLEERVTAMVNGERPEGAPEGPPFGRRGRFGPPPAVDADDGEVTDTADA